MQNHGMSEPTDASSSLAQVVLSSARHSPQERSIAEFVASALTSKAPTNQPIQSANCAPAPRSINRAYSLIPAHLCWLMTYPPTANNDDIVAKEPTSSTLNTSSRKISYWYTKAKIATTVYTRKRNKLVPAPKYFRFKRNGPRVATK